MKKAATKKAKRSNRVNEVIRGFKKQTKATRSAHNGTGIYFS